MSALQKKILYAVLAAVALGIGTISVIWDSKQFKSASPHQQVEEQEHRRRIEALEAANYRLAPRIRLYAGSGHCKKNDECQVLGLGARICDGFHEFAFYSVRDAQEGQLKAAVAEFNENMTRLNDLSMKVQSCGKPIPEPRCIEGRCMGVNN